MNDDLNTLISVLESPVFQSILNIQDSLRELKRQVKASNYLISLNVLLRDVNDTAECYPAFKNIFVVLPQPPQVNLHPSILPEDFDITPNGELILNLPPG